MALAELGSVLLRVYLGFAFFVHGFTKFEGGIGNTVGFFEGLGLPGFLAYAVALFEVIGGLLFILGFGTRYIAVLFFVIMAGAFITVNSGSGFVGGYELDLAYAIISLYFILNKLPAYSLDAKLSGSKTSVA